jgi:hypothetical protein
VTFDELKLAIAIQKAQLGGRDLVTERERKEAACLIYAEWVMHFEDTVFPFTPDDIDRMRLSVRKNNNTKIKVDVAIAHGVRCFFYSRGKGPCCSEAECGHLTPRSKGGDLTVQNCQIECRSHNNQRREMLIEEYLQSDLTTECLQ